MKMKFKLKNNSQKKLYNLTALTIDPHSPKDTYLLIIEFLEKKSKYELQGLPVKLS